MTEPSSLEPSIALTAYAEPLAANRRVLVFGNALGSLPQQLMERGARAVHVCDSDALRVAEATARNRSTQISFSSLADSDLSLRDGAFELSLVDNLGAYDPLPLIRTAKRALTSRGVAVVACPNPEAAFPLLSSKGNRAATSLDYYALYDAVAAEFEHVRMLGQTPFVGYAIADFSASGEPEPALDTSLVPGGAEEPDFFIALASNQEVRLDEFAVIQLPTRRLLGSVNAPPASAPVAAVVPSENLALAKARDAELARLNQWIKELESRASTADERADHSETELDAERAKLQAEQAALETERRASVALKTQHEKEISAARAELSALRTQATNLRADASNKASELARLKSELAERDQQLAAQTEKLEQGSAVELAEFERQLTERGSEVRRLEQDLRTAERTGRELVRELERRTGEQSKQASLELERALAEREADLQAAAWTIESLSLRLELAGKPLPAEGPPQETALPGEEAR